jgi:outer membrane lipoprotein-sorting protein
MKRLMIIFMLAVYSVLSSSCTGFADEQLSEILDGILKKYGSLPGIEIPYKREIITGSMALLDKDVKSDTASGKMYFKPPDSIKLHQETPSLEVVTIDGKTLWWYVPNEGKVYKYPADELGKELILLSNVFQGLGEVGESFDVILGELDDKEEHQLQLFPNPPWQEVEHINIIVSRVNYSFRVVVIFNYLGSMTRFILGEYKVRDDFDNKFFSFDVPEGVEVIDEF